MDTKMTSELTLPEKWSKFLSEQPETGMGFQDVAITLANGKAIDGFVLNGSVLETALAISPEEIVQMRVKTAQEVNRWK